MDRLAMSGRAFGEVTPLELAWRVWGERRRRNRMIRTLAWMVSEIVGINVSRKDQSKVTPQRMFLKASGGDVDKDEV